MAGQAIELSYAVRLRVIGKYFGQLCLVVAVLTLVPLSVASAAGDWDIALRYCVVVAVLGGVGGLLSRLRAARRIQVNEAMILAALTFLLIPLLMTYPMMRAGLDFVDALFEAISGVTTTGLSTLATVENKPLSFLFARAWMQWYGGLGVVVLSLALVMRPGITAKCLAVTEDVADDLVGGTKAHARRVLLVYGLLTFVGVVALLLTGSRFFDAVVYSFSAVSTGGFAPSDSSLGHFPGWQGPWVTTLACLAGALPLALYHRAWRQGWKDLFADLQLRALFASALLASVALGACMFFSSGLSGEQVLFHAPLMALSAQSTAGFSSLNPGDLDAASKMVLIVTMAVGGGLGSTAGGIKLLRILVLLRLLQLTLARTCLPSHAILDPRLGGRRLHDGEIRQALLFILMFIGVVTLSWFFFLLYGYDPLNALFEVVSATGTVGLSAGVTNAAMPDILKGILCLDMLMGRLEILAWLVIFYPRTWIGKRMEES